MISGWPWFGYTVWLAIKDSGCLACLTKPEKKEECLWLVLVQMYVQMSVQKHRLARSQWKGQRGLVKMRKSFRLSERAYQIMSTCEYGNHRVGFQNLLPKPTCSPTTYTCLACFPLPDMWPFPTGTFWKVWEGLSGVTLPRFTGITDANSLAVTLWKQCELTAACNH